MVWPKVPAIVLLALSSTCSFGQQIPLFSPTTPNQLIQVEVAKWNLSIGPSVDSTSHLVFDTVASLLQHWPNTRYRNGHNIIPGLIPIGTLLYHGSSGDTIPDHPEWTATDPEHSRLFCSGWESGCWHFTFMTTRPLKVLYFDGSSAAKMDGGSMDTQDYVAWNASHPELVISEAKRILDLCEWGRKYQLDGFYRMEMDFELMLCDFSSGVQLVSSLKLNPDWHFPNRPERLAPPLHRPTPRQPPLRVDYKVIESGAWHNFYPGESRIKLDLTRLVSFYDTYMFPSLVSSRSGLPRLHHRIAGLSEPEAHVFKERLDEVLRDFGNDYGAHSVMISGSGIDWRTLYQVIADRYVERLELLQYILNATDPTSENYSQNSTQTAENAMYQLQRMLTSYAVKSARPSAGARVDEHKLWASPVYQHCATTHTSMLHLLKPTFTRSEHLLLSALEGTNREICRVIVGVWAEGIEASIDPGLPLQPIERGDAPLLPMLKGWKNSIDGLMNWLGWSIWLRCQPACTMEEFCYMPTWPLFKKTPWPIRVPRPGPEDDLAEDPEYDPDEDEWRNPLPRCLPRMEPFDWRND